MMDAKYVCWRGGGGTTRGNVRHPPLNSDMPFLCYCPWHNGVGIPCKIAHLQSFPHKSSSQEIYKIQISFLTPPPVLALCTVCLS